MKPILFVTCLTSLLPFSNCTKSTSECSLVPAKIIRYDCDRVIMQLLTSESIGDASWTDIETGQSYTNVVSYYNTCQVNALTNGEKDTIYVKAEKTTQNSIPANCVQCMAIAQNPPQTKVLLTRMDTEPCRNDK